MNQLIEENALSGINPRCRLEVSLPTSAAAVRRIFLLLVLIGVVWCSLVLFGPKIYFHCFGVGSSACKPVFDMASDYGE